MGAVLNPSNSVDMSLLGGGAIVSFTPLKPVGVVQGTWVNTTNSACKLCNNMINSTHSDGDECYFNIMLSQGTYTLQVNHLTNVDEGILKIYLDAVLIKTIDLYSGAGNYNAFTEETGIIITSGKLYKLTLKINGKNASSNNHYCQLQAITFLKTA